MKPLSLRRETIWRVLAQTLALLAVLAACALAQAASGNGDIDEPDIGGPDAQEGEFSQGNVGAPQNSDSENVPGLGMGSPSYAGSGCPQGSVSAILTADQRTLSVLFSSYVARAGGATGSIRARSSCQLRIPFQVPAGYRVQIVKLDYRGFAALPQGAVARFKAGVGYDDLGQRPMPVRRFVRASQLRGPLQQDFQLSSHIVGPPWSPCGQSFTLSADSVLNVVARRANEEAVSSIDSLDAVTMPVRVSLRWQRCDDSQDNRSGPGGHGPNRPDRPGRQERDDHGRGPRTADHHAVGHREGFNERDSRE